MRYLKEAVVESRRLINGLRSLALDDLGLAGALEQLVNEEKGTQGGKRPNSGTTSPGGVTTRPWKQPCTGSPRKP